MSFILPEWPVPASVKSIITTRSDGVSQSPYASFNLAEHVGDQPDHVEANRRKLLDKIGCPIPWIHQVHGCDVVMLNSERESLEGGRYDADAVTTKTTGVVCAILTADCLPLLICDRNGSQVAAVHAGWRGLAAGIVSKTIQEFTAPAADLMVYLGPAISQSFFQVGEDVVEVFLQREQQKTYAEPVSRSFKKDSSEEGKYLADLYRLAKAELNAMGVKAIFGGNYCTYAESDRFYSFRRDGVTGRMASLIWLADDVI